MTNLLYTKSLKTLYKSLFLNERRVRKISAFFIIRGIKKAKAWKRLIGFKDSRNNFQARINYACKNILEFGFLLADSNPTPRKDTSIDWLLNALINNKNEVEIEIYKNKFPSFAEFSNRGVINPFKNQILKSIDQLINTSETNEKEVNIFLKSLLSFIEQGVRRAFILELNIQGIKGNLQGEDDSARYRNFIKKFDNHEACLEFYRSYPVLLRAVVNKLDFWEDATRKFTSRLKADRELLEVNFGIRKESTIIAIHPSGDTHNSGQSVMVVEFSDGKNIVYKPRSTSLESNFQKYIEFFNKKFSNLNLRTISAIDRGLYGWVEFVKFSDQKNEYESDLYHFKLGFLTSIIYSINGVDIFFENLISSGIDPVIIDLETMFHTPIETNVEQSPAKAIQFLLNESVSGIGILPQPNQGALESEVFDVSVMGAKKNAQAPYKVAGIENFGLANMRITEIPGWIPENKSSSENSYSYKRKTQSLFDGLKAGLECVFENRDVLASPGGIIDSYFSNSERRLIIRDTKVYGSLQQDEMHPDLLRNQIDREWHLDNLWSDIKERPALLNFINSELNQIKQGDIPYFFGSIDSLKVTGGDGTIIDLSEVIFETPIQKVKNKLLKITPEDITEQLRIAAATLALDDLRGLTQPKLDNKKNSIENSLIIAEYLMSKANYDKASIWCDTTFNPAPKAHNIDPVRVVPSDPFLYEGIIGISMFLYDLWDFTKDEKYLKNSIFFTESVFKEIEFKKNFTASGFVGLASVIYVVNRCIEKNRASFSIFESRLELVIDQINEIYKSGNQLDFLTGLSGTVSALIPYSKRTKNKISISILKESQKILRDAAKNILISDKPIEGMNYLKGLSHGISGIALSLYRLSELFQQDNDIELTTKILLKEYFLIGSTEWTDSHNHNGGPLVGWCHGSAGIALAIDSMPKIYEQNTSIKKYYKNAYLNTLKNGIYGSKCLCHGTAGNLLCISSSKIKDKALNDHFNNFESDLLKSGFSSLDPSQSMSIGLMTGLTGAGYFLLGRADKTMDYNFLTLS